MKNDVTGVKDISAAACSGSLTVGSGGALQAHSKGLNNKHNIPPIWYRFMFVPLFAFDRYTPQHTKALWGTRYSCFMPTISFFIYTFSFSCRFRRP